MGCDISANRFHMHLQTTWLVECLCEPRLIYLGQAVKLKGYCFLWAINTSFSVISTLIPLLLTMMTHFEISTRLYFSIKFQTHLALFNLFYSHWGNNSVNMDWITFWFNFHQSFILFYFIFWFFNSSYDLIDYQRISFFNVFEQL